MPEKELTYHMKQILALIVVTTASLCLQAQVSFNLSSQPNTGSQPWVAAATDVNGDGKLDLVSANGQDNTLTVLTNSGGGIFVPASLVNVGSSPLWIIAANLNGDGRTELSCVNNGNNTISVLTNNGSGVFVASSTNAVGSDSRMVNAADVNGDGKLDLITINSGSGTFSVLTNNGVGGFTLASSPGGLGGNPYSLAAADVNGDGSIDLICGNLNSSTLSILTNKGNGDFALSSSPGVASGPFSITAADVNGDGKADLISANIYANSLSVLTNNGSGGFALASLLSVGNYPSSVTAADINGDGKIDLIDANQFDATLSVFTNKGGGAFGLAAVVSVASSNPNSVTAADVNGDGKPDLISANLSGNTLSVLTNATSFPPTTLPVITAQPAGQTNLVGTTAAFNVGFTATGVQLFSFQWQLSGTNLPSATNSTLVLPNLTLSQAGNYALVIANAAGSVTSSPAMLDVRFILVKVNGQVATGTVNVGAPGTVTLSGGYPGGFLFYTLDGSAPATSSTFYTGPIVLNSSALVRTLGMSSDFLMTAEGIPVTVQVVPTFNLQTSVIGNGTLSTNPPSGPYVSNSVVTLIANAGSHSAFDHWAGDATGNQNPLDIIMNGPRNVQAVFAQNAYPLTLTTPGGGNLAANGQVIAPATYYPTGSVVSIVAAASNGWSFVRWQGSVSGSNNPLNVVMDQTNNIQGIFGTVVATNSVGGSIVFSQPNPIPYGTSLTVSAVPDAGNYLLAWSGNVSGSNAPTRIMVTNANPNIIALFTPLPVGKYTLNMVVNGNGFVTNNPQRSYYNPGDTVTMKATNNAGAFFFGWAQDASGTNNPLTILMTTNKNVQANFGTAPTVSITPLNLTILAGNVAVLSATALGLPPLTYQWQKGQGAIAGATNATFTIPNIQPTNAGSYFVVVTNSSGSVTSAMATVTVVGTPVITNQPTPLTVLTNGHAVNFVVGASGWPALAYQWKFNGTTLNGATSPMLNLPNAFPANAGVYTVVITNVYGSLTSNPAMLTVSPLIIAAPAIPAGGQFQFSFDTATGVNYVVQYSTNLTQWLPFLTVGGVGAPLTLTDPNAAGSPQRFYRILMSSQ